MRCLNWTLAIVMVVVPSVLSGSPSYFKIKTPGLQHAWQVGQFNGLNWVSAFEGGAARNVSTLWNNLNIHLDSVPTGDDYYVLFLDYTHGNVYSMSEPFSIIDANATPTAGTVATANAGG